MNWLGMLIAWGFKNVKIKITARQTLPLFIRGFYYWIFYSKLLYCPKDTKFVVYFFITQEKALKHMVKCFIFRHMVIFGFLFFYSKKKKEQKKKIK